MRHHVWALALILAAGCGSSQVSGSNPGAVSGNNPNSAVSPNPGPVVTPPSDANVTASNIHSVVCTGTPTWSDEFSGSALDTNKWNYEVNCDGGGNGELECYVNSPNNVYVDGQGHLVIKLIKQNYSGKTYTSGRINSATKGDFVDGCFEARLQVPLGQGLWPAFWMLSTNTPYGSWPQSGELDIMEILGQQTTQLYGTAHFGPPYPQQQQSGGQFTGQDFSQDFHTFSLQKTSDHVTWYVDGVAYFTLHATDKDTWGRATWPFDAGNPFHFIFNVAMGGAWPKTPDPSITSASMKVDYVRAYAAP